LPATAIIEKQINSPSLISPFIETLTILNLSLFV